jgi:hypothetical protein
MPPKKEAKKSSKGAAQDDTEQLILSFINTVYLSF